MAKQQVSRVVFQPETYRGLQRGINQMAEAVRPTLGPLPRVVAVEHPLRHRVPELLDSGATITKRIIELPDRDEDMGAMILRHVLWHVHERAGDGTATAAVLLQSVYNEGVRYLAAGGSPMRLRDYLKEGTWTILTELNNMTVHLEGEAQLVQIAEAICHDPPLARLMGEIFDIIGEYGRLEIKAGNSRNLEREYVEGLYWESTIISREMITNQEKLRTDLGDSAVLLSNLNIEEATQLVPVIKAAKEADVSGLMVIASKFSDDAIALMMANSDPEKFRVIGVKAPGHGQTQQGEILQDVVKLTGGRLFLRAAGDQSFNGIGPQQLGRARRTWANQHHFGIIGGQGDPRALRQHIIELRSAYKRAGDMEQRQALQERIGKLVSGSAILRIGGATKAEVRARKEIAERAADAVRGAMIEGVNSTSIPSASPAP